jgi:hypothetical protein
MKRTRQELELAMREVQSKMGEFYDKIGTREELTAEELAQEAKFNREVENLEREFRILNMNDDAAQRAAAKKDDIKKVFREYMMGVANRRENREILLLPSGGNTTANIEASGAIALDIKEMIPTLHEGLGLPIGTSIVTGVTGNELYPVSINDVKLEEVGETVALNDQVVDFAKIQVSSNRVGCSIPVSRHAIANAAFDLMAFIQEKVTLATRIYLAEKIYSPAVFSGNHGPFSGQTPKQIVLDKNAYANILEAVAEFSDQGFFEGNVCISMSRKTEAYLKATPKIAGAAGGFVIENGLCAGYPYTLSHYVNSKVVDGTVVPDKDNEYLEIGYWEWFALQSHDTPSLIIDATSSDVAMKNIVRVVFNSFWSMTDLSTKINGGKPAGNPAVYPSQAFQLYKVSRGEESSSEI